MSNDEREHFISEIKSIKESFKSDNFTTSDTTIKQLRKEIDELKKRLTEYESNITFNKNMYDILLFIIFGVFIILFLDGIYRILLIKIKKIRG